MCDPVGCSGVTRRSGRVQPPQRASTTTVLRNASAIESRYAPQLSRLAELAQDSEMLARHYQNNPVDEHLFASPEILDASIKTSPHSRRSISSRDYNYKTRSAYLYKEPTLGGRAAVNRLYDVTESGASIDVVEYRRPVTNDKGERLEIELLLSLDALRTGRANGPNQRDATDSR